MFYTCEKCCWNFNRDDSYLFIIIIFYFTVLYWFCHISTCICHGCTHVPHPEPLSHHPPHTIPLGHPSAPAPRYVPNPAFLYYNLKKDILDYITCSSSPVCSLSNVSNIIHIGWFICINFIHSSSKTMQKPYG